MTFNQIIHLLRIRKEQIRYIIAPAVALLLCGTLYAQVTDLSKPISVAKDIGVVTAVHKPADFETRQRLVLIQDIHADAKAQRNLASILDSLVKKHELQLVMVEGGWGDVNLTQLRKNVPPSIRMRVAQEYLVAGMISGEEYLQITTDYPIELWGVEEEQLYKDHYQAFLEVESIKASVKGSLKALAEAADAGLNAVMNPRLAAFEATRMDYTGEKISLPEYAVHLGSKANGLDLDFQAYPNTKLLSDLYLAENRIRNEVVASEQQAVLGLLSAKLPKADLAQLKKSVQFLKNGDFSQALFYREVLRLAQKNGIRLDEYRQFALYVDFLNKQAQLDFAAVMSEVDALESRVQEALIQTAQEKELLEIRKGVELYRKLLDLHWRNDHYMEYQMRAEEWRFARWVPVLEKTAEGLGQAWTWQGNARALDQSIRDAVRFYRIAHQRDEVMANAVIRKMSHTSASIGALVIGGFHSKGVADLLTAKGIEVTVVTPLTGDDYDSNLYAMAIKEKNKYLLSGSEFGAAGFDAYED